MSGTSPAPLNATPQWSSRLAFIMAAVGSSVGLGNLWRFSAEAGANGGGAFILIYVLCVLLIGIPVLMSEYLVGRAGHANSAVMSVDDLTMRGRLYPGWSSFAWIGMVAAFLIVSFYCVVAAWVMLYIPKFIFGAFDGQSAAQIGEQFTQTVTEDHMKVFVYFSLFAFLTAFLVSRGVNKGIEMSAKILMPLFFLLLAGLCIYSVSLGLGTQVPSSHSDGTTISATRHALGFMFLPDFSAISALTINKALGQAFFSIGIGSAIMITYGSYLPKTVSIPRASIFVGLTDTCVAIIAGLAIFPIVMAHGLDTSAGAGLFFKTLPVAINAAPGGHFIGAAFFFLAFFAAITSSVSLFEPAVSYVAERFAIARGKAALIMGLLMWAIGAICVFYGPALDFLDQLTGTIMLPLSGLLLVIFVGWRLNKTVLHDELHGVSDKLIQRLLFLVRFVAPIAIFLILSLGVLEKYFPLAYHNVTGG